MNIRLFASLASCPKIHRESAKKTEKESVCVCEAEIEVWHTQLDKMSFSLSSLCVCEGVCVWC